MKEQQVTILIVEDEEALLQSLNNIISRRYENVYTAPNAQQALKIFGQTDIDLIITDIRMSGMDGLTMLQQISAQNSNVKRLVMSAYSEPDYFLKAIDLSVDGYLVKPFNKEKLLEAVERLTKIILLEKETESSRLQLAISEKRLRELNNTKDKFFSIIGHDVKTPVSTIASYSNLIIDEFDDLDRAEKFEILSIIKNSSFQALDLLKNLLEWAKVQSGSIAYNPEIINVCDTVAEEVQFAAYQWKKKKIQLHYAAKPNNFVYADQNMTRTVFRNLLSNAIKFTPDKGIINITSQRLAGSPEFIEISISDTGIGIPKRTLKTIFDLSEKISTAGTSGEKGSGMGLIFCKDFIDIQGGNISAKSTKGKGSVFSFSLPASKLHK